MEYRIIEKRYSDGRKYYVAQYMHDHMWQTLQEVGVLTRDLIDSHFSSVKEARKDLRKKKSELEYACYFEEIEQGKL